jgi:hypothetical protein
LLLSPALALIASQAWAQDYGTSWADRVARELDSDHKGADKLITLSGGELYYFDNNIFLTESGEVSDSISLTFVNLRLDYSGPVLSAYVDITVNYKYYLDRPKESGDEERAAFQLRFGGHEISATLTEIFRFESDPTDSTFAERIERVTSNTVLSVSYSLSPRVSIGTMLELEYVFFLADAFRQAENIGTRAGLSVSYKMPEGYDVSVDGGYLNIHYLDSTGPSDSDGYFFHAAVTREATQRLTFTLGVGYSAIFSTTDSDAIDVLASVRFEISQTMVLRASYTRRFGFSIGEPFQTNDQFAVSVNYDWFENFSIRLLCAYSHLQTASDNERDFFTLGLEADYRILPFLDLTAGTTYRMGDAATGGRYDDFVFHIGIAGSW